MAAVALENKLSTGHDGFPPTRAIGPYTTKSFINGLKVQLKDYTKYDTHCSGRTCHYPDERITSSGSSTFYLEGKQVCRIGDSLACGDVISEGSSNTFIA